MAEVDVAKAKRGRPSKEKVTNMAAPAPVENVETSGVKAAFAKAKAAVVNVTGVTGDTKDQVVKLAKGVGLAALDSALVYLKDNLNTVNFGTFNPIIQSLGVVGIGELRNMIYGGPVSGEVFVSALKTHLAGEDEGEAEEEKTEEVAEEKPAEEPAK